MNIDEWNRKIYKNEDGSSAGKGMHAQELWNEFGIKSYPLFKDACYSHVPEKWAEDVRRLLEQVKEELHDKISFIQIKEKWCWLTIYFTASDDNSKKRFIELRDKCIDSLILKGVHPPRDIGDNK